MSEHSIRIRPSDGKNVAFYAPAADITHGMKGVVRAALRVFDGQESGIRVFELVGRVTGFMRASVLSQNRWEGEGLDLLDKVLEPLDDEERGKFLTGFFRAVMDFYWHSMRITTESPEIQPEHMSEALNVSEALRNMPRELREKYLDHMRDHGKLPPVMDLKASFVREVVDAKK